jgi:hypothetical protein
MEKGATAERAVVAWLRDWRGLAAERIRSGRSTDPGDIVWPGSDWLCDVKSQGRWRLPEWWREVCAEATAESSGHETSNLKPLLVLKVPGETDPGQWLAVVRLEDLEL